MSVSRRELLTAFLGMPALWSAGCGQAPPPLPAGEIVGPALEIGHRLREGYRPVAAADAWQNVPVVIVGGGVAGLAAAWRLQRAGYHDYVLLELEEQGGGTARCGQSSISAFPWGAHYLPAPFASNRALVALLEEMEILEGHDALGEPIVREEFLCRDPEERIYYRGHWYEGLYLHAGATADDTRQLRAFLKEAERWAAWKDSRGRRAFSIPLAAASDDAEVTALDRQTMADWLDQRQFHSPRLRWLVNYACRDDYGLTIEQTSAWAGLFYFAARQRQSGGESQPLITWPEGNGRLVAHLQATAGKRVRLGQAVTEIATAERGLHVTTVAGRTLRDASPAVAGYRADHVIFAAPQFLAKYLVRQYREQPPAHLSEFEYGAWMVANLQLRDRPETTRGFPLAWDNVLYESPSLGYVTATHQRGQDYGPTVLTYYYPLCEASPRVARERLLSLDWAAWADIVLTDLSHAHRDIRELTTKLDVMRWGHAMIRPRPGFLWGAARQAARLPRGNLYFAHSDLSGLPLFEEAFYHGVAAAEQVLQARGLKFSSIL